jgi:hypothetical protein
MKKTLIFISSMLLVTMFLVAGMISSANALYITPSTGSTVEPPGVTRWEGNETSQNDINTILLGLIGTDVFLYKSDVGSPPVESGPLDASYDTVFNPETDPSGADITYTGGDIVGSPSYLLVKDGKQTPAWYLFELAPGLGWDGTEILQLRDFWPNEGAISHVALYGDQTPIPEPTTMLLFGTGLIGLIGFRKKFKK